MDVLNDLLGLDAEELLWYQMMIRAVLVFGVALLFIRITGMRSFGAQSAFDIVFSITIGGVLSRCITGHYPFFSTLLAAFTLAFCHKIIALLARNEQFRRLTEGDSVCLYKDKQMQYKNMRRYAINKQDLIAALHAANLDEYAQVKSIWYETSGEINIVKNDS